MKRLRKLVHGRVSRWALVDRMFLSLFYTGAVIEFSTVGAAFVDGILTSRFLGADAMAGVGLALPIYSIVGIVSGLIAVGMQVHCSQALGRGNRAELSRYFSLSFYVAAAMSVVMAVLTFFFADPFAAVLGAKGNAAGLLKPTADYLRGLSLGFPGIILYAVAAPAIQMDSGSRTVQVGALMGTAVDIILDLAVIWSGGGVFGIAFASAASQSMSFLFIMLHFLRKDRMLRFVRPQIPVRDFLKMLTKGSEKAIRRLMNTLRPIFLNALIISYGGAIAMSALSVRNNLTNFAEIFGSGIAAAVSLLTGMYYGEVNSEEIGQVKICSYRTNAIFCGGACVLMILLADPLASLFVPTPGELRDLVIFAIRMLAIQTPLHALVESRIRYLQAIQRSLNMNLLLFSTNFVFVLLSALILGRLFGVYGILACFTVSDLLSLIAVIVYCQIKVRKAFPSIEDFMALPEEFDLYPGNLISLDIRNLEDISLASEQIMMFCQGHRFDRRVGYYAALATEEICRDIILGGFSGEKDITPLIDLRVVAAKDFLTVRIRDNCPHYDITEHIAAVNAADADPTSDIGVRIVSKAAEDIRYLRSFDTNIVLFRYDVHGTGFVPDRPAL